MVKEEEEGMWLMVMKFEGAERRVRNMAKWALSCA